MEANEVILKFIVHYEDKVETIKTTNKIPLDELKKKLLKIFNVSENQIKYLTLNYYDKDEDYNQIQIDDDINSNLSKISENSYQIELFLSFPFYESMKISPNDLAKIYNNKETHLNEEKINNEIEQSKIEMKNLRQIEIDNLNEDLKRQLSLNEKDKKKLIDENEKIINNINDEHQQNINKLKNEIEKINNINKKVNKKNENYENNSIRNDLIIKDTIKKFIDNCAILLLQGSEKKRGNLYFKEL